MRRRAAIEAALRASTLVYDRRHAETIVLAWELVADGGAREARLLGDFLIRGGVERRQFWLGLIHDLFGEGVEVQVRPGLGTPSVSLATTDVSLRWRADGAQYEVHTCPEVGGDWYLRREGPSTGRFASCGASSGSRTRRIGSRAGAPPRPA